MVVKVYISGISGNKEVKKRQQRVLMILDSKNIKYEIIDITEPGRETDKDFMQNNSKSNGGTVSDPNPRSALPPQVFNDEEYCGDYDLFDLANELDTLELFLKVEAPPEELAKDDKIGAINGEILTNEGKELSDNSNEKEDTMKSTEKSQTDEISNDNGSVDEEAKVEPLQIEMSPVRQKSEENEQPIDNIEETVQVLENEPKQISKENTPVDDEVVNENGAISSREQSEEKQEQKKETPSEAFIQSEQSVAAD